ncbi:MAG: rhodanese-like domain-containing protein [Rhabdochlamydiaceae bacterium]|nr:rhodanese-like domain-containing protein [Rhabdochlamydiaceae bacterium]
MKKSLFSLLLTSLCFAPFALSANSGERFLQSEEAVKMATYGHIDAKGLKALLDSQTPLILLDARGDKWNDGNIIPGAILASYENSEEELEMVIPTKDSLVVVYCFSFTCPLSARLAQKLVEWGYVNVVEYPAGLKEWRDIANYQVAPIQ